MTQRPGLLTAWAVCCATTAVAQAPPVPPVPPTETAPSAEEAPPPGATEEDAPPSASSAVGQPTAAAAEQADLAAEEASIAAELAAMGAEQAEQAEPPRFRQTDTTLTTRPTGNVLNPAVSANGLLLAGGASESPRRAADLETGLHIQEVELRFSANVDPYMRADLTLAAHADHLAFEEAFLTTLEIPYLNIRAGQMYAAIGRHNLLHTHAFPFVTGPHASRELLGPEGLRDPGVSLDVLLPLPFYAELNAQVFRGEWHAFEGEAHSAEEEAGVEPDAHAHGGVDDLRKAHDFAYVGHLKLLFEAGNDTTVELGGSYVGGRNGFGKRSDIVGGDLTVKWRPLSAERYTSFDWSSEILWVQRQGAHEDNRLGGAFSGLRYQFAQRFWVQARYGVLGLPQDDTPRSHRTEGLLAFIPSEFSGIRLQYAYENSEQPGAPDVHEVFLQTVFSIGPHPPHDY